MTRVTAFIRVAILLSIITRFAFGDPALDGLIDDGGVAAGIGNTKSLEQAEAHHGRATEFQDQAKELRTKASQARAKGDQLKAAAQQLGENPDTASQAAAKMKEAEQAYAEASRLNLEGDKKTEAARTELTEMGQQLGQVDEFTRSSESFKEIQGKLKEGETDVKMDRFSRSADALEGNNIATDRWNAETIGVQDAVAAVNRGDAAAGPDLARSNDMNPGMERVADTRQWEFESPQYEDTTFRTDNKYYVSEQPISGSDVKANESTWGSLQAKADGSETFQDFQGGVNGQGSIRTDGTVRVGDSAHFNNQAAQPGGFNLDPAEGTRTAAVMGTDSRVFQATADPNVFTSGGQQFEMKPNGTLSQQVVSDAQLQQSRDFDTPAPVANPPAASPSLPQGVTLGQKYFENQPRAELSEPFYYKKGSERTSCSQFGCTYSTTYTVSRR